MTATSQRWVIALLLLNILLTVTVLMRQELRSTAASRGDPESLSERDLVPYAQRVVNAYNDMNVEQLYALYHEEAREKLSRNEVADQLKRLHELFGPVERISYLNNVRLGEKGAQQYYQAHFSARVSNASLDKAQLMLHLILEHDNLALYGMRLNAAQP